MLHKTLLAEVLLLLDCRAATLCGVESGKMTMNSTHDCVN